MINETFHVWIAVGDGEVVYCNGDKFGRERAHMTLKRASMRGLEAAVVTNDYSYVEFLMADWMAGQLAIQHAPDYKVGSQELGSGEFYDFRMGRSSSLTWHCLCRVYDRVLDDAAIVRR
jgi:hypothetical protein